MNLIFRVAFGVLRNSIGCSSSHSQTHYRGSREHRTNDDTRRNSRNNSDEAQVALIGTIDTARLHTLTVVEVALRDRAIVGHWTCDRFLDASLGQVGGEVITKSGITNIRNRTAIELSVGTETSRVNTGVNGTL